MTFILRVFFFETNLASSFLAPSVIIIPLVFVCCCVLFKRRCAYFQLSSEKCNLPTVIWLPRFFNYNPKLDDNGMDIGGSWSDIISSCYYQKNSRRKKLGPSTITNVLPRMERLNGPYGMYATLYGLSTKVVHVAHPVPARLILMGNTCSRKSRTMANTSVKKTFMVSSKNRTKHSFSPGALKSPAYDHFKNFSGDGVFTSDGLTWKMKRASVLHCLLKGCTRDGSTESQRLELEANRAADSFLLNAFEMSYDGKGGKSRGNDQQENRAVNIVPLLQKSTVGLIYRLITHHNVSFHNNNLEQPQSLFKFVSDDVSTSSETDESCDELSQDNLPSLTMNKHKSKNTKEYKNILSLADLVTRYLDAVTNIRMIILAQSRSIWFLLPRWTYRLLSPIFREEERIMITIREFARMACKNAQPSSPLHSLRFRASHNSKSAEKVNNGSIVNKDLLDEAITLLFAGQDTTAATLSWTLHLLSLYPQVQDRLVEEINQVVEDTSNKNNNNPGEFISRKMIAKMPFLDAVLKESMRLYPVAPFIVRKITDVISIPIEQDASTKSKSKPPVVIPEGTLACIWIYGLHRNKKLWHRPDDFIPDRWINPTVRQRDPAQNDKNLYGAFMPFAAGPRNCLGQPLAHIILRIVLSKIMRNCVVSDRRLGALQKESYGNKEDNADETQQIMHLRKDMQAGFTVLPLGGVELHLHKQRITCKKVE